MASARACKTTVVIAVLAMVGAIVGFRYSSPVEPSYAGKTLTQWLDLLGKDPAAANALAIIGSNAVPHLVAILEPHVTDMERSVWSWARVRGYRTNLKIDRRWKAIDAFNVLGSRGSIAVPQLIPLLAHSNTQNAASAALGAIGDTAALPLVSAISNGPPDLRLGVARALGDKRHFNEAFVIPALIRGLADDDWRVRAASAESLGRFRKGTEVSVDALLSMLRDKDASVRASAAIGLRLLGTAASAAVPALREAEDNEKDEDARREAETAIDRITAASMAR